MATWGKQNGKKQVRTMLNRDVLPVWRMNGVLEKDTKWGMQ